MDNKDYTTLYTDNDKAVMKNAEDSLNPKLDRVNEIIEYGKISGIKHIGIANCTRFNKEAVMLEEILRNNGFQVSKTHCKLGKMPFDNLIKDYKGLSCNPAGQADFLAQNKTELNIMMGLCLGHDMIFNAKSEAPVTPLVVKDRKLNNNTLQVFDK